MYIHIFVRLTSAKRCSSLQGYGIPQTFSKGESVITQFEKESDRKRRVMFLRSLLRKSCGDMICS